MISIGNVELPIVSSVEEESVANSDEIKSEIDSVVVKHEPSVKTVTISGFLNNELHSSNVSINEQKSNLKSLRKKQKLDNSFNYKQYKGYLLVKETNVEENGDSRIVHEFEIVARYFPWPKYYPESEP